ncbi:MAG: GNAT family N-acetyltransferase, partial [Patescibacteria group bacterium]
NVDTGYCFVAENKEKIVGFILAYETLPFRETLYIRYIGVNPELQDKGVGLMLCQKLIEKAKQAGITKIWSLINTDNPQSIKLHEKIGFKLNDRKEAILDI